MATPRIMAPMFSADMDSKRSAPRPAQSPTLSPTRSATTAAFRGSSSGMPASILPTRSAPRAAALVWVPPAEVGERAHDRRPDPDPDDRERRLVRAREPVVGDEDGEHADERESHDE